MPTKQWVDGEDFLASDINTLLQKQTVQTFPNATARNAEIPNPTVGMVTFLMNTAAIEVYTDKTTPSSWRPPWNTAWGLIYNGYTLNMTLGAGYIWIVRPFPVNLPGRNYKIEFEANCQQLPSVPGTTYLRFQDGGTLGLIGQWAINNSWGMRICLADIYEGLASRELGIIGLNDGPGGAALSWTRYRVYDVGPVVTVLGPTTVFNMGPDLQDKLSSGMKMG